MAKDEIEIRREIEATRAELGETVEALSRKTDVRARVKDAVRERTAAARGMLADVTDAMKVMANGAMQQTTSTKSTLSEKGKTVAQQGQGIAQQTTQKAAEKASQAAAGVGETVGRARRGVTENPLGIIGAAFAVGFLTGLALPVTQVERERVGPLRDQLVERAQDAASEAIEQGRQQLQETVVKSATNLADNIMPKSES